MCHIPSSILNFYFALQKHSAGVEKDTELLHKMFLPSSCRSIQVFSGTNSSVFSLLKLFWRGFCKQRKLVSHLSSIEPLSSSKYLLIETPQTFSPVRVFCTTFWFSSSIDSLTQSILKKGLFFEWPSLPVLCSSEESQLFSQFPKGQSADLAWEKNSENVRLRAK